MKDYVKGYSHSRDYTKAGKGFGSRMYATSIQKNVYVVTGAPGSGKSHMVNQNMTKFDIVFDYDRIADAMSPFAGIHGNHMYMKEVLLAVRETVINCFASRSGEWHDAYFITASPDRNAVDQLIVRMNAVELHMKSTMDECITRIQNDDTRPLKARDIELVRDYFMKQNLPSETRNN